MKLLLGQNLKESDVLYISLASIYGIGKNMAVQVCNRLGLSPMLRIYQVPNQKIAEIAKFLSLLNTEAATNRPQVTNDIVSAKNNTVIKTKNQQNKQDKLATRPLATPKATKTFPILPSVAIRPLGTRALVARELTAFSIATRSFGFPLQIELKKQIRENINELVTIKSYRGFRHIQHLPCRGQRTKTNAHTCKRVKPGA